MTTTSFIKAWISVGIIVVLTLDIYLGTPLFWIFPNIPCKVLHVNTNLEKKLFKKDHKQRTGLIHSSSKGVVPTPLTVFALVLKIAQPRGKIAPGTFKFILSLHFSETNSEPTTYTGGRVSFQSWEVFFELDILKIFEVICTHKFICK